MSCFGSALQFCFCPSKRSGWEWSEALKELSDFIGKRLVSELIWVHSYRPEADGTAAPAVWPAARVTLVVRSMLVSLLLTGTSEMFIFKVPLTSSSLTNQGWHVTHLTCLQQWKVLTQTHMQIYNSTSAHSQTKKSEVSHVVLFLPSHFLGLSPFIVHPIIDLVKSECKFCGF